MKKRFTYEQIIVILREAEIGAMSIKALWAGSATIGIVGQSISVPSPWSNSARNTVKLRLFGAL